MFSKKKMRHLDIGDIYKTKEGGTRKMCSPITEEKRYLDNEKHLDSVGLQYIIHRIFNEEIEKREWPDSVLTDVVHTSVVFNNLTILFGSFDTVIKCSFHEWPLPLHFEYKIGWKRKITDEEKPHIEKIIYKILDKTMTRYIWSDYYLYDTPTIHLFSLNAIISTHHQWKKAIRIKTRIFLKKHFQWFFLRKIKERDEK